MNSVHATTTVGFAAAVLALGGLAVAARRSRSRWLDEPTEPLPILTDVAFGGFDEIARIERGAPDPDFAALARGTTTT